MSDLPPDLARLGDDLVAGATRATARRERRRRFAIAVTGGALAFAALTPAALGPAQREVIFADTAAVRTTAPGCDHPRGARFTMLASCRGVTVVNRNPKPWFF
jgi:hypothetical protein